MSILGNKSVELKYDNGLLQAEGLQDKWNGKRNGEWSFYTRAGILDYTIEYRDDVKLLETRFFASGSVKNVRFYFEPKKKLATGKERVIFEMSFYENGTIKTIYKFGQHLDENEMNWVTYKEHRNEDGSFDSVSHGSYHKGRRE